MGLPLLPCTCVLFLAAGCIQRLAAQDTGASPELPPLQVSSNGRFLETSLGKPFFWMGDTAWRITRITPGEVELYLTTRARQGFTVIQMHPGHSLTSTQAEVDYADNAPFVDLDVNRPNEAYWRNVDRIVGKARECGLYVDLFPLWGGEYGRAFSGNPEAAYRFGRWIGLRYGSFTHVVWTVSGEYSQINGFVLPIGDSNKELFNAMASGLRAVLPEGRLLTIHPGGQRSSSVDFHSESWLSFNMVQSGHFIDSHAFDAPENYDLVAADYLMVPTKPVVDGEPIYEDTPDAVWKVKQVSGIRAGADVVRRKAYWAVFAGAFGHTYGHNDVYPFFRPQFRGHVLTLKSDPSGPGQRGDWRKALQAQGARQMGFLRKLMESRPFFERVPDQSVVFGDPGEGPDHAVATRDAGGSYLMVYLPRARRISVGLANLRGAEFFAWWFNPRNGKASRIGCFHRSEQRDFQPRSQGDWVLVLDSSCQAAPPGK